MAARRQASRRLVPLGYLAAAFAVAALILPTVLRPPQDQQNTSASFSPDAPPDDSPPEALIQSIRRAQSSTAGRRQAQVVEEETIIIQQSRPPQERKATRAGCFGDPPRQEESLYSALCVPAWTGTDNGGATGPGVTADTIRIAIPVGNSDGELEGDVPREYQTTFTSDEEDWWVYQTYFNERYEFYGRYLQLCIYKAQSNTQEQETESIGHAIDVCDPFAILTGSDAGTIETIRRKRVHFGSINNPMPFYRDNQPYAYAFQMDSWMLRNLASELICKQWNTRPLGENNLNARMDPSFDYDAPRKYGLIAYQDATRTGAKDYYAGQLAKCGIEITEYQEYNLDDNSNAIAGSAQKMKLAGVTTMIVAVDALSPAVFSNEAQRLQYWPEYVHAGTGGVDSSAGLWQDDQARHLVGISSQEIPRPSADQDWYRAYKEIHPDGDPAKAGLFRNLQQIAGGIQHAGGVGQDNWILTPESFQKGLLSMPYREPVPEWSIGGGYRMPDDFTYRDYVNLQWWDQDAAEDDMYCYVFNGKRYKLGDLPDFDVPWFDRSQCIYTPGSGLQG